jgi:uncharacterized SAM-binding protein YcdF (DUF218 family)
MSYPSETIQRISDFLFIPNSNEKADLILVLGSNYLPTMETVADLYKNNRASLLLISGKHSNDDPRKETESQRFLNRGLELGIPSDIILLEAKATNTKENLLYSKEVLQKANLLSKIKTVLIVCQNFHTRRVLMTANAVFGNSLQIIFHSINDSRKIEKDNWWLENKNRDRVLDELRRISEYTAKGDLSLISLTPSQIASL